MNVLRLIVLGGLCAVLGCEPKPSARSSPSELNAATHLSELELHKLVKPGMAKQSLLETFGPPSFTETSLQGDELFFYFFDDKTRSPGMKLDGFSVSLKEEKIQDWSPMYREIEKMGTTPQDSSPSAVGFERITFVLAPDSPLIRDSKERLTQELSNIIEGREQLEVRAKISIQSSGSAENQEATLEIPEDQLDRLKHFTKNSAGQRLIILLSGHIIGRPLLANQIVDPVFQFEFLY